MGLETRLLSTLIVLTTILVKLKSCIVSCGVRIQSYSTIMYCVSKKNSGSCSKKMFPLCIIYV